MFLKGIFLFAQLQNRRDRSVLRSVRHAAATAHVDDQALTARPQ